MFIFVTFELGQTDPIDQLMDEKWSPIPGYPGYFASPSGKIKGKLNQEMAGALSRDGYHSVKVSANGKPHTRYTHILIALTFIPNPDNLPTVDHINRDRTDNRVENLRWASHQENAQNRKERTWSNKRTSPVIQLDDNMKEIKHWDSIISAARALDIEEYTIRQACALKIRAGGFYWKYYVVSDLPNEEWKSKIFNNITYQISSEGRFKNKHGVLLKGSNHQGYIRIGKLAAHRMVAKTFIPQPPGKTIVNHINGIRDDNRVVNLEWVTIGENNKHAWDTGLNPKENRNTFKRAIVQLDKKTGLRINYWKSANEVEQKLGISHSHIAAVCRGKRPNAGGYKWRYAPESFDIDRYREITAKVEATIERIKNGPKIIMNDDDPAWEFLLKEFTG